MTRVAADGIAVNFWIGKELIEVYGGYTGNRVNG